VISAKKSLNSGPDRTLKKYSLLIDMAMGSSPFPNATLPPVVEIRLHLLGSSNWSSNMISPFPGSNSTVGGIEIVGKGVNVGVGGNHTIVDVAAGSVGEGVYVTGATSGDAITQPEKIATHKI
jgi:hypothetical protein